MKTELVLVTFALSLTSCEKPKAATPAAETIKSDGKSVTLTDEAPQWKYVEMSVAKKQAPLNPLPVPARVDLDEKRTSNIGVPLSGRVESVLVRQRVLERVKELFDLKAAAQKDLLSAEAEVREAELALKAAESKQRSLQVVAEGDNLFWVKAARAGTVVDLDVYAGQEVTSERDKPLIRLSDLDEVLVIADLPEADVAELAIGEPITIRLQSSNGVRDGVIEYISEVVDPKRRTVEVRARAKNADRVLRPNAFVEVVVTPDAKSLTVRVPDAAVVTQGTHSVVFVATSPGHLEPMNVVVGRRSGGETEIRTGLEEGARYVSRGALLLLNQVQLSAER